MKQTRQAKRPQQRRATTLLAVNSGGRLLLVFGAYLFLGCGSPYTPRRPRPIEVAITQGGAAPVQCTPAVPRTTPDAGAPSPESTGALRVAAMFGDDRFAFDGAFISAWSHDNETLVIARKADVLFWSRTGAFLGRVVLPRAFDRTGRVQVSTSDRKVAVQGVERAISLVWVMPMPGHGSEMPVLIENVGGDFSLTDTHLNAETLRIDLSDLSRVEHSAHYAELSRLRQYVTMTRQRTNTYVAEVRQMETDRLIRAFPELLFPQAFAISGDQSRFATLIDGELRVYNSSTLQRITTIPDAGGYQVALSPDGRLALVTGLACVTRLTHGAGRVDPGACSTDLVLWAIGEPHASPPSEPLWRHPSDGIEMEFSPSGRYIHRAISHALVERLFRTEDGQPIDLHGRVRMVAPDDSAALVQHERRLTVVSLDAVPNADEERRLEALSPDGTRSVWRVGATLRLESAEGCVEIADWRLSEQVHFVDAGTRVLLVGNEGEYDGRLIRTIDAQTGHPLSTVSLSESGARDAHVMVTEHHVHVQGSHHDDVLVFTGGEPDTTGFAPRLSYTSENGLVWEVRDTEGDRVSHLGVGTRAGSLLAVGAHHDRRHWMSVWNLSDPDAVQDYPLPAELSIVAASPNETMWAVGLRNGQIRWLRQGGQGVWVEANAAHQDRPTALLYLDEARMVSAARDGQIMLFNTTTGELLGRVRLPLDHALRLARDETGRIVVETFAGQRLLLEVVEAQ